LICTTDGCAAQYRSGTAFYLLTALAVSENITIQRRILAPGHGKGIIDSQNGMLKTKLTQASARLLMGADEGKDEKKLTSATMIDGIPNSVASDCVRYLQLDDKTYKDRRPKKIKKFHYHVRPPDERVYSVKYKAPKVPKGLQTRDFYHIYACPEMGAGKIAMRRIPCHCLYCKATLGLPWDAKKPSIDTQPRFGNPHQCKFRNILGDENNWHFTVLEQDVSGDKSEKRFRDDEANRLRTDIQESLSAAMASVIRIGGFGAIATEDEEADGYYLVQFISDPYECQESSQLIVEARHLVPVPLAPKWYTKSTFKDKHLVNHVVCAEVMMDPISDGNPLPNKCNKKEATQKGAMKIRADDDYYIKEEIIRREALEDPDYERFDD